ncbi:hypothetical protein ATCCBAA256_29610 [Mycobacterium montefiorense]|nr:hypothetical protein ATCCBAA256_29610 [Mycobacterium montefiorense]
MTKLLDGKVVVISGVGPGLGTTLAHRCTREGADLVLAARTPERLDDVAKQIADAGGRAATVRTDITDDDQVNNLVAQTLEAYGRVDVLVNNAFRVPSLKPFSGTPFSIFATLSNSARLARCGSSRASRRRLPSRRARWSTSTPW